MVNDNININVGDFIWQIESRELKKKSTAESAEEVVVLTPKQYQLLRCLYDAYPEIIDKEEIVEKVWGGRVTSPESLPQLIIRTRQTIRDEKKQILINEPGVGYSLKFSHLEANSLELDNSHLKPIQPRGRRMSIDCWMVMKGAMLLLTAMNIFFVASAFYHKANFIAVHQANAYPNVSHQVDGTLSVVIGSSKCIYDKKKLSIQCE